MGRSAFFCRYLWAILFENLKKGVRRGKIMKDMSRSLSIDEGPKNTIKGGVYVGRII